MDRIPFNPYDFFGYLASGALLFVGMELVLGFPTVLATKLTVFGNAALLLGVYAAGHLIATPAKAILEDIAARAVLGRPSLLLLHPKKGLSIKRLLFHDYTRPLPSFAREAIKEKVKVNESDTFIYVRFDPTVVANKDLMARLTTFQNQYTFARNLCFTALLVGGGFLAKYYASNSAGVDFLNAGRILIVSSVILFYRFLKFYRLYAFEVLLTYARSD